MMQKLTFIFIICMVLLTEWNLCGQTQVVGKTIALPTGEVRLKAIFASITNQTGYVFSYDSRKINDKKLVFIGKNNIFTLKTSLSEILPPDIRYKMIGKYIVLYKKPSKIIPVDKIHPKPIVVATIIPPLNTDLSDSISLKRVKAPLNSSVTELKRNRRQCSIETTYNPHLMHLSLLMGEKTFFGKASICYDYHESYHVGLGVGMNVHLTPVWGLSLDLTQYALVFGKTRKMDINTYTTELNPLVSYTLNKRFKIKFGPTVFRIKSNLMTRNANIDLGSHLGYNATIGMQILLFESK